MTADRLTLEHLARAGFAARGLVYCLVGGLAALAAIGSGGEVGGGKTALGWLLSQPFGAALLGAVGLGLLFFAGWRLLDGTLDADRRGGGAKALGKRALLVLSALVNAGLAVQAFALALGWGSGGGEDQAAQDWTAWLLGQPFGPWLVGVLGAGVAAGGAFLIWKGFRGDVLKRLAVPAARRRLALALGRFGTAARGVTFVVIGLFLALAALHSDSDEVKGLGGALRTLETQPYGWAPLGLVALGLVAFGLFSFAQALWRRIEAPDLPDARSALAAVAERAR